MISIFSKKTYLVDLLDGFVDIHNHILPGIDDGAQNVDESIALLKGFSDFGVKNLICTPHIMHNFYDNTPETIAKAHKTLQDELDKRDLGGITVDFAAEHMIDDNFDSLLDRKEVLPLGADYLLVEMSFLQPPIHLEDSISKLNASDYFPILAHPERYRFLHSNFKKFESIKKMNVLFQTNLLSISGYYGNGIKQMAYKLIDAGLIDFLGSDVHNTGQLEHLKMHTLNQKAANRLEPLIDQTIHSFAG